MFVSPEKVVEEFGLQHGMHVADFGSGVGHYVIPLAKRVGDLGRVYCIDIQKDLLSRLKNDATKQGVFHVEAIWGDIEKVGGSRLKDGVLDAVLASNIFFQVGNRATLIAEIKRVLKPGGKLMVVDWSETAPLGPQPDRIFNKEAAQNLLADSGFAIEREFAAGDHHYGLIAKKI